MFGTITVLLANSLLLLLVFAEKFQAVKLVEKIQSKNYEEEEFRFASYYQDHMVLQRAPESAIIWGYGSRSGIIIAGIDDEVYVESVNAGPENAGIWSITLKPHAEGGPFSIPIFQEANGNTEVITLNDVYFGEVWVCGGQSNMAMSVNKIINSSFEIEDSSNYPLVRIMQVALKESDIPLFDLEGISIPWSISSPESVPYFSAVCWLYGKYLYEKLQIPFGLIQSSWGGTAIETWSSDRALKECDLDKSIPVISNEYSTTNIGIDAPPPEANSVLWNAMIHPLLKMTIKGVIWYQGEKNAHYNRDAYNCSFPALIADWRTSWYESTTGITNPEFPFGFAQISIKRSENWEDNGFFSSIRWHQTADFGYVPNPKMRNTFMAVTIDLFDNTMPEDDAHPTNKQYVAERLALGARHRVYDEHIMSDGPFPDYIINLEEEKLVEIKYRQNQPIGPIRPTSNFQMCCIPVTCGMEEPPFHRNNWTNATVVKAEDRSVYLDLTPCPDGINAVRYAWTVLPCDLFKCEIYNTYNLPAAPFYMEVST